MDILKTFVLGFTLCVLFTGCGKQHKAEGVIDDFVKSNIALDNYTLEFAPVDSTDRVTPERIAAMRKTAGADRLFKRGVSYAAAGVGGTLLYTRAKIINGTDTIVRTFYLDPDITHVVAFKQN